MALEKYNQKRDFSKTAEPKGTGKVKRATSRKSQPKFVVQEHHARSLHYDLRLEVDGLLKSWAVPKGPSLDPSVRRLAVMTEDHPMKYLTFHGTIPQGNYGAGQIEIWDTGTFETDEDDPAEALNEGKLPLVLHGQKLHGAFTLVRLREENQWLLLKSDDEYAEAGWELEPILNGRKSAKAAAAKTAAKKPALKASKGSSKKSTAPDASTVEGARQSPMPQEIKPMLATLVEKPPIGDWLYEIKWDGYRALAFVAKGQARLVSRNQIPMEDKFPELAAALAQLPVDSAIIDGEIVVLDEHGRPNFQLLQNRAGMYSKSRSRKKKQPDTGPVVALIYGFDLLFLNGYDLKGVALSARKQLLQELLAEYSGDASSLIRYSDHVQGSDAGLSLLDHAREVGLEGVIAKQAESTYLERRSDKWQKIKLVQQADVVIGGYTAPRNSRAHFGALVIGLYRDGKLHYVGHTGSGFNAKTLRETADLLKPLETAKCPFVDKPATNQSATWVEPKLVCEVRFTEWTQDGNLRHPIFGGLRFDKDPKECVFDNQIAGGDGAEPAPKDQEAARKPVKTSKAKTAAKPRTNVSGGKSTPKQSGAIPIAELLARKQLKGDARVVVDGHEVALTSLDKLYWADEGLSKGDLLQYYCQVSDTILPYLRDRPLILERFPAGIKSKSFHQHNIEYEAEFLETYLNDENGETIRYALCNNLPTLLFLANLGSITQHVWLSRVPQVANPDWIVFDLDPGEVEFKTVCKLALELKGVLEELGIEGCAKTSGSSGMHVCVPVEPLYTFKQVEMLTELVARTAVARRPDIATLERSLRKRPKQSIYLDHMQNREGKSVASAWSARAKPGATVSTPLTWAQVKRVPDPASYNIVSLPKRLQKQGDPWQKAGIKYQSLQTVLAHLQEL